MELSKRISQYYNITVITSYAGYLQWREYVKSDIRYRILSHHAYEKKIMTITVPFIYLLRLFETTFMLIRRELRNDTIIYSASDFICDVFPAVFVKFFNKKIEWVSRIYHIIPYPNKREGRFFYNLISCLGQRVSFWLIKRYSDVIISLNSSLSKQLVQLGFPASKIFISGAGIDFCCINSVHASNRKIYDGVFFGRIAPQKGISDLIKIWQGVVSKKHNAKLLIMGGGLPTEVTSLVNRIESYGLKNNINYLGYIVSIDRIYTLLKSCRLYLFTDHENGWGISVAEGMACSLPVVAYNLDIFGAVHKKGFISVPLKDTNKFIQEVLCLLDDEQRRQQLGLEAYEQARGYDWDFVADGFLKLLEKTYL